MELLLIRHGIAEDAERPGPKADALRALTAEGRRRMKECGAGLRELVPAVTVVATSPLRRAVESAAVLAAAYRVKVEEVPALKPGGDPRALLRWLGSRKRAAGPVAVVGHEPHLSSVASLLLTGRRTPILELKKGGACLLVLRAAKPGTARLEWLLTARALRNLGDHHAR